MPCPTVSWWEQSTRTNAKGKEYGLVLDEPGGTAVEDNILADEHAPDITTRHLQHQCNLVHLDVADY